MLHNQFLLQLNRGVIIRNGKISDDPSAPSNNLERREALLNYYIATCSLNQVMIGIKPIAFLDNDRLNVLWSISALKTSTDFPIRLQAIAAERLSVEEKEATEVVKRRLEKMERQNEDIEAVFEELGFKPGRNIT